MIIKIHNLEFPAYVNQLSIDGYTFMRVPEYRERLRSLHHHIKRVHEFDIDINFGEHNVTAEVSCPEPEPAPLLKWGTSSATHLSDILLMLSLFTLRHVWPQETEQGAVIADHRTYQHGWALPGGLPFLEQKLDAMRINGGFEPGINRILKLIATKEWQALYRGGHYLMLANHAFRRQIIETTFLLCWTIWEHLFVLHNNDWLDKQSIHRLSGREKIAFVLSRYGLQGEANIADSPSIGELENVRNRLIHFGMFPEKKSIDKATTFVKWTEYLVARTLGLYSTESFESLEKFEDAVGGKSRKLF